MTCPRAGRAAARRAGAGAGRAGFTLVELLVSITLLALVMSAVVVTTVRVQRDVVRQTAEQDTQGTLRTTEMVLTRLLRIARADPLSRGVGALDPNPLASATWNNIRIRGDHNPADGDVADALEDVLVRVRGDSLLVRWQAGQSEQFVAFPVRSVAFSYFAADGTPVTLASQIATAQRVRVLIDVPRTSGYGTIRRETWAYLRN